MRVKTKRHSQIEFLRPFFIHQKNSQINVQKCILKDFFSESEIHTENTLSMNKETKKTPAISIYKKDQKNEKIE